MLARPSIHTLDKADIYTERWLNEEIISVPGSIVRTFEITETGPLNTKGPSLF